MEYFLIIISAIFVNNIVLAQFLGICPFLGVSSKISTATGMSIAVCFVITLATVVTFLLNQYLLVPFGLDFLQTIAFILVIAALVQIVEIVLKKVSPALYKAMGIYLPLITTNCAVLGVAITVVSKEFTFGSSAPHMLNLAESTVYALVIAALVQIVEIVLKKVSPSLYKALGIYLPLITTNCAVLGVAITVVSKEFTFGTSAPHMLNLAESTVYALATSLGYGLAMILFSGIREHLALNDVPKPFRGLPIALITVGIMAMAFLGFSGMV